MNERTICFSLLIFLSLGIASASQQSPNPAPAKSQAQTRADALLDRARDISDIHSKNAPAFRLKASFSFVGKDLEAVQGTYTEVWISDSQWRRETIMGKVRRVEVGLPNRRWLLDTDADFPAAAARLPDLVNIFPSRSLALDFESVTDNTETAPPSLCAVTRPDSQQLKYAFCFDTRSGALLSRAAPEVRPNNTASVSCVYGIFRKFGVFWYPREMACFEESHKKIDAKIEEISAEPSPDTTLFKPPAGAIELGRCSGTSAQPVATLNPEPGYPMGAHGEDSSVSVSLIVDTHGKPQHMKVNQSGGKVFDEKALEIVQQWRFTPGTCDGESLPMKLTVTVYFKSQGIPPRAPH